MKNKIIGFAVSFLLIISCAVFLCACSDGSEVEEPSDTQDGIVFKQVGEEYAVKAYEGKSTTVVIPAEFNGKSVTSIMDGAFKDKSELTSVTIPETVVSIGAHAFSGCVRLSSVKLPGGLKSIGQSAFYKCSALTSVTLPSGITKIERSTFENCPILKTVTIPTSVTSIENYAFYKCSALESINYEGGTEEWQAIVKSTAWNYSTSKYTINCSDGVLKK